MSAKFGKSLSGRAAVDFEAPNLGTGGVSIHESIMIFRFIAFLLSLCIGLPMCWCSLSVACPGEALPEACCAAEPTAGHDCGKSNVPSDDCMCCGHDQDSRETAKRAPFEARKPGFMLALAPMYNAETFCACLRYAEGSQRHSLERGPPADGPRLYLRQCALLL